MNITRRNAFGVLAAIPVAAMPVSASRAAPMTARERYAHHLAELKKAAEEIEPRIAYWHDLDFLGDESETGCGVIISAHMRNGRYEGDGVYETEYGASYPVRLLSERKDGQRMFAYRHQRGEDVIPEDRLEAFIKRKVS
ncbi:hypothetical protein ACFSOZ_07175 [Mesorhizobium newzealandense]|uniref:DUF1801 domain-containing protein n=1 Tax=Mesorhizobium newzealandense TaxID=1300302 RepID=A0ABW4U524_9HYPH